MAGPLSSKDDQLKDGACGAATDVRDAEEKLRAGERDVQRKEHRTWARNGTGGRGYLYK